MVGSIIFIVVSHPVHTILSLIVVACAVSGVCLLVGAEFLGFLFVVIYVGAIAVLFLFVVMMIAVNLLYEEDFNPLTESFAVLGFALIIQLLYFFSSNLSVTQYNSYSSWSEAYLFESNLTLFNHALYSGFFSLVVVAAGVLLLVAMVGSIFLTVQDYTTPKSQLIYDQLVRSPEIFVAR